MSHTLTIDDKRISSGELSAVDDAPPKMTDWWADFGLGDRSQNWPSPPLEKCVETSGLHFLRQVSDDLRKQPPRMSRLAAAKTPNVIMVPPGVLPPEAALSTSNRSVWAVPAILGAFVLVALLSALGALWFSGRIVRPEPAAMTAAPGKVPGPPMASASILPPVMEPSATEPSLATMAPSPAATLVGTAPPTQVDEPATPTVKDDREAKSKRHKRKKRSRRSADSDADDDKPVTPAPGYSLYATLGAANTKATPTSGTPVAPKSGGVVTEATPVKRTVAPAGETYRMLKVAASRETAKPTAGPSLPPRLPASAISRGLGQARSAVQACLRRFGFGHATIRLRVTVAGATGRVTAARALGRFGASPVGSCALRRVRSLRFPRFARSNQTILLPIRSR